MKHKKQHHKRPAGIRQSKRQVLNMINEAVEQRLGGKIWKLPPGKRLRGVQLPPYSAARWWTLRRKRLQHLYQ